MKKIISWTTGAGKTATVTVELVTERRIGHDDHLGDIIKPCADINVTATVEGMGVVGYDYRRVDNHPQGVAATCGKLGILEANAARIDAAIAEFETTPEWQAQRSKEARAARDAAEYEAGRDKIERAMREY